MARLDDRIDRVFDPRTAKILASSLDVHTAGELLRHYPRRYEQRGELTDLAYLRDGEHVTVLAQIKAVTTRPMRNRRGKLTEVTVTDGRGTLTLAFFRQPWREKELKPGLHGLFAGQVSSYGRKRQLIHPDCELLGEADPGTELAAEHAAEIIPVYPATSQLASWKIAKAIRTVLDTLDIADDPLPAAVRDRYGLLNQVAALHGIHRPLEFADIDRAKLRLKWDEAFVLQAVLAQRRRAEDALPATARIPRRGGLLEAFDAQLPFPLTGGQRAAGEEIMTALCREHPMHRLLQGEVGSGKTLVAVRAMLQVVDDGGQAVLLAPTEVLAQQHYRSLTELLGPLGRAGELDGAVLDNPAQATRVALLTGSQGAKARRAALDDVASGAAGIVIGTHTLLYHRARPDDQVVFEELGLVVIDEQHRFGVQQRDALREKARGSRPHVLVMTATPIPRTVAMTVYGDLDVCTLSELPAGRTPITSHVVPAAEKPRYLERTWERLREEVDGGGQAYVVCPRIGLDDAPAPVTQRSCPASQTLPTRTMRPANTNRTTPQDGHPVPCSRWPRNSSPGRWPGWPCACCTGGCPRTRRTTACAASRTGRWTCWWRPPWSRSVWTCRTPPSWSSWTPTGSACPSCTSCAAGSAAAPSRDCACW